MKKNTSTIITIYCSEHNSNTFSTLKTFWYVPLHRRLLNQNILFSTTLSKSIVFYSFPHLSRWATNQFFFECVSLFQSPYIYLRSNVHCHLYHHYWQNVSYKERLVWLTVNTNQLNHLFQNQNSERRSKCSKVVIARNSK